MLSVCQWWAQCQRLSDAALDAVAGRTESLTEAVKKFNEEFSMSVLHSAKQATKQAQVQRPGGTRTTEGVSQQPQPRRTLGQPIFTSPNVPINVSRIGVPAENLELAAFQEKEPFD